MTDLAVQTRQLVRTYGRGDKRTTALDHVDFEVRTGELFGLLGPNGAGKTTLIKILVTLLLPDSGEASVAGFDVMTQAKQLRPLISMVSGGEVSGYGILKVREQLWLFSQVYGLTNAVAKERIDRLLDLTGLTADADKRVYNLSTGMRQKMNFCRGLVSDPKVLFLDEPTVGLDVASALDVRQETRRWINEDRTRTVILTTHYMQEAEELCDRVAIVNAGTIVALGTPAELRAEHGQPNLEGVFLKLVGRSLREPELV